METRSLVNLVAAILVTVYAIYLFVYVVKSRIDFIRLGKAARLDSSPKERIVSTFISVFGQKKLLRDRKSGIIHLALFYGFILVQFSAIDLIWKGIDIHGHVPLGRVYPVFTFSGEVVALMILLAVYGAFHRRFIEKLPRLKRNFKAGIVLIFIAMLMVTSFLSNSMLMIYHGEPASWSAPIASLISLLVGWLNPGVALVFFYLFWWLHLLSLLSFLVYIPQSKHAHIIVAPINLFLRRTGTPKLQPLDLADETAESFGVSQIEELSQLQLIDLYACVECGRCTNVCPANLTGKTLSPMALITKMRDHLTQKGAAMTSKRAWVPAQLFSGAMGNQPIIAGTSGSGESLIGDVITPEELWACTTCRNCEDQCPVGNEHVDKILDMRRYLTLMEGAVDPHAQRVMQNIERQDNPWGIHRKSRTDWQQGYEVPIRTVNENPDFDYLLWVGAMGSFDQRSQKITKAVVRLLVEANVSFAILGNEEKSSGDTPRRFGNEFLFQELAEQNIALFNKYHVKKMITIDPHAFHVFKNEYPDFGFHADVYHHSEILAMLLQEKRLIPTITLDERITYHDSCYLGRYNNVYDAPRQILKAIDGVELVEMERNRENAMCCGAGGGLMWVEESSQVRVNVLRAEQALAVAPTVISSGCPYCLTMLTDGVSAVQEEETVATFDVAEVLAMAVFPA